MELASKFTATDYNAFAQRVHEHIQALVDAGYEAQNISFDELKSMILTNLTPLYPPHLIKDKIFNATDEVLDVLDRCSDWINPYSQEPPIILKKKGTLRPYVQRWLDWINYNEKICNNEEQKHQYLFTIENGKEEQLYDIEGKPIITLEGFFSAEQ